MKGVISMSGKKMYSTELKPEIVQRYLKGTIGLKQLAEQYHISSKLHFAYVPRTNSIPASPSPCSPIPRSAGTPGMPALVRLWVIKEDMRLLEFISYS